MSKNLNLFKIKSALLACMFLNTMGIVHAQDFIWGKQFGTAQDEKTRNLVVDSSGNVYVVGKTKGAIGKQNYGGNDGFIVKIDDQGNIIWTRQFGTEGDDELTHVTVDKSGYIYATGFIADKNNDLDVLTIKLKNDGDVVWQKQFGTDRTETGVSLIVDTHGDIYLIGATQGVMGKASQGQEDCFILHLDNDGNQQHVVQFGTSANDQGFGISLGHNSNIYVCGQTEGDLEATNAGQMDLFWGVFSKELKPLSFQQFGTTEIDYVCAIKTDSKNNVYIAGGTRGTTASKQKGNSDAFLQKWNEKGEVEWTQQFGTPNWDGIHGIEIVDGKGILISGCYDYPSCKSFIKMYDENGTLLWNCNRIAQGKGGGSCGKDICVDNQGVIYHAGYTGANLFSDLKGEHDLFLVCYKIATQ